jgi:Holliday junction DNA helicase RuvA
VITSVQGTLTFASTLKAIIEINGLGYEVNIPLTTSEKLPALGSTVKLHTLVIYREDSQNMYGFSSTQDRDFFRLMIEHVSGVGPKVALSIMSRLSLPLLENAIRLGDVATLAKCPGIGRKTAERLIIELKTKVGGISTDSAFATEASAEGNVVNHQRDAISALIALGYKAQDADQSVRQAILLLGPKATTEALIKKALG